MSRVQIANQPWGLLLDEGGNVQGGRSVQVKHLDGTNATHWSAITGGSSATTAVTSNSDGTVPRFIEPGQYELFVDSVSEGIVEACPGGAYDRDNAQAGMLVPSRAAGGIEAPTTLVANRALFGRVVPSRDLTITSIAFGVTTAAGSNDACDVGIYTVSGGDLSRVVAAGATTGKLNATGVQTVTITSTKMRAGVIYYVGVSCGTIGGTAGALAGNQVPSAFYFLLGASVGVADHVFKDTVHPLPATVTAPGTANTIARLAVRET